jgi:TRAP-type transport system periplasmic protein
MTGNVKRVIGVLVLSLMVGIAWVVGAEAGTTTLKFSHTDTQRPFESVMAGMSVIFKDTVERETGGQIKVNFFPSSQLGKEREVMEMLKMGGADIAMIITEGTTVSFFPPLEVLGVPYLFPSIDVAFKVMDGPFGRELKETMRKETGMRMIATAAPGPARNFATKKVIRTVEDLKGLRIRTMEHPAHQAMVKALGASPTPIATMEIYSSIQSGVVDGLEMPYTGFLILKCDELIKNMIVDEHVFNQHFLFVNDKWFLSLPPDQQRAVTHAGQRAQEVGRAMVSLWEAAGAEEMRAKGVQIYVPPTQELKKFKELAQPPVLAMLRQRIDKKWVDGMLKAVEQAAKEK